MIERTQNKLCLGTAQFGFDYGINNIDGRVSKDKAYQILNLAYDNGIELIDTAYSYGESEKVIGDFMDKYDKRFNVVSKLLLKAEDNIEEELKNILKDLRLSCLYGLLIHDFEAFLIEESKNLDIIRKFKSQSQVEKIGFSLYHPNELRFLLEKEYEIDIVQIPFNIFDQRFSELLPELRKRNIEVHVRSVFLQGLFFREPDRLEDKFSGVKEKISRLHHISSSKNIPVSALCINFVLLNDYVDRIIVGVDSFSQLKENLSITDYKEEVAGLYNDLVNLREDKEDYILPYKWAQL